MGGAPKIRILDDQEFITELLRKLKEEAEELVKAKGNKDDLIKEISDVYEVIESIIKYYDLDEAEIKKVKVKRKNERGGFSKKIFLESVD